MLQRAPLRVPAQSRLSIKRLLARDRKATAFLVREQEHEVISLYGGRSQHVRSIPSTTVSTRWKTLRGLVTAERNRKLFRAELEALGVDIPLLTTDVLEARAFRHHAMRAGTPASRRLSPKRSTEAFRTRLCVSYLADSCDAARAKFVLAIGKSSVKERTGVFFLWLYREIGRLYPEFEDECIAQLEAKGFGL